jgi:uncharacterized membrane protein YbhN (UPF0104 family)
LAIVISMLLLTLAFWMSGATNVMQGMSKFSPLAVAGMLLLLVVNLFLVSFRLWRILEHYGIPVSWRIASRASIAGHVAGLFVMSLFGQVLGRQTVLRHYGVQPVVIASLAAYERVVLTLISALLCLMGAGFLMGQSTIGDILGRMSLAEIVLASAAAVTLSLWFGGSRFEFRMVARMRSWPVFRYLMEVAGITLVSQVLMLGAFVVAVLAIQPNFALLPAVAAAAVISFAASMPITVNGWGIREIAAVYVLGHFGISGADAVAISVMVGLCSTVVILISAAFSSKPLADEKVRANKSQFVAQPNQEIEKTGAWILAAATAVLVFFQVQAELPGGMWGVINLNFADPFAILALAAVGIHAMATRHAPRWRVDQFNTALLLISLLLLAAFLNGVLEIGVTHWALGGRLLGWMVLLGYVSAGYLIVAYAGALGLRRLSETLVAAGMVVVVLSVFIRLLSYAGCTYCGHATANFEGYAGNRNAFAFQMLVCLALLLAYSNVKAKISSGRVLPPALSSLPIPIWIKNAVQDGKEWSRPQRLALPLGIILLGVSLSASRAGWLVAAVMLIVAWVDCLADRRLIARGAIYAACLLGGYYVAAALAVVDTVAQSFPHLIPSTQATTSSDQERFDSISRGLDLWLQSPWVGAGLGVFIEKNAVWFGHPVVIHSTPVWILAEFGIVGVAGFGWVFLVLFRYAATLKATIPARRILGLLLLMFALFSLVHEVFYQRIFWLVLGAVLASPGHRLGTGGLR